MPTRVIEIVYVRGRRYLRLRETRFEKPEPYAALSYCWGGTQCVTTTTESIYRHLIRINMQDLQATIKDAVVVTERLGIMKLWVDAFCIIQDDVVDKAWEIAQMPLVYSQATVTIVASRADRAEAGFLHDRKRIADGTPNKVFQLPYHCSTSGQIGSVILVPPVQMPIEPLDLRAWALQERFLSTRIIDYGEIQTRWICQAYGSQKGPTDGFGNSAWWYGKWDKAMSDGLFLEAAQDLLPRKSFRRPEQNLRQRSLFQWYHLVRAYTDRSLTLGTDRLPAISGIAAQFGEFIGDEYKAGLWASDLGTELRWRNDLYPNQLQPRPVGYQGPSWSWASVSVPVRLFPIGGEPDDFFEVLECETKIQAMSREFSVHDASFGAVESGKLVLRGRLQPAEWIRAADVAAHRQEFAFRKQGLQGSEGRLSGHMYPDAIEEEFTHEVTDCIPVFLLKVSNSEEIEGLVLRRSPQSEFSRLGIFGFHRPVIASNQYYTNEERRDWRRIRSDSEWLDDGPVQTITIV